MKEYRKMALLFDQLKKDLQGKLYFGKSTEDNAMLMVYASDASVYQEKPMAVVLPESKKDIKTIIDFAGKNGLSIIPRAAGTSLAGQVVGNGIVVDISKFFTEVLEINQQQKWVRVQPGVIRDDLNAQLKSHGLMFGPETSTSNRAMIGGMIGNNSCGLHSIIWGDTRNNLLEVQGFLSDGSEVIFKNLNKEEYTAKLKVAGLEGDIYRCIHTILSDTKNQEAIKNGFPKASIKRRNTGYALDTILEMFLYSDFINLSQLIAGSEGTLFFITEAKLQLLDLPPLEKGIVAVHTNTIQEALFANMIALKYNCAASELVDDVILEYTKINFEQSKNRFFVEGDPRAILMVEFFDETGLGLGKQAKSFINALKENKLGYAYPLLLGNESLKAWELRKAGLGLLRNEPGDTQPVNLIEDCAVDVNDLPAYIDELEALLQKYGIRYSMYAHAGAGELHVEPMINLKTTTGKNLFRKILEETTALVKKYNGSLSGEHGDGRLRGEFIPFIMGEQNFDLFKQIKKTFDPNGIFNKGKITDAPPMNEFLRYRQDEKIPVINTTMDFSLQEGILHLAEKCSGSGDCRKTHVAGGTMCPSYMATRSERDTTRARANMLRHFYTDKKFETATKNEFEEVKDILDLCLSCKGCKSECPSSVDVGKMKAEFSQQYHDRFGVSVRSKLVGNFTKQMKLAAIMPRMYNFIFRTPVIRKLINNIVGFHPSRSIPLLHKTTLLKWYTKRAEQSARNNQQGRSRIAPQTNGRTVYLFADEFSNYNDVETGQKLIMLLEKLGYQVIIPEHIESGRTYLSKGLVKEAQKIARKNVDLLKDKINEATPIIGIEPSAILTLRDEYLDLVSSGQKEAAKKIAASTFLFEEWFAGEIKKGKINNSFFTSEERIVQVHGHCHQKALSSVQYTIDCLSLPAGYKAFSIPSGCCGMAGSFGYEKEHYDLSMQIGELILFPAIRKFNNDVIIAAPGTSCRHQIKDGTQRKAKHPAEILFDALLV